LIRQVGGHYDYAKQIDAVLEVIGVRTRERAEPGAVDSLRQWSAVQRCDVSTSVSPAVDSALGDDVDEAVEAIEYVDIPPDSSHN